ncbi:CBS domain-containing protein [Pseudactinotalea suaedae]|jgi:CBS domain-containing protein|uniref:CBS domain-containing protein n=1 Tax=Pseudactinotalea suaedae TaxID=1524924 RepID=UPI0012E31075|nr:CBS domain-containing protein [Pseudactinotalea suaedae]
MRIAEVIRRKGADVVTVAPDTGVAELVALLDEHKIGALVVSPDGGTTVVGIVSERDVVRHLHTDGAGVLERTVAEIMTDEVQTCAPEDELESLARRMTDLRVRHLPVLVDGHLHAIVSIGDVVKNRLDELQDERDQLVTYVQQ